MSSPPCRRCRRCQIGRGGDGGRRGCSKSRWPCRNPTNRRGRQNRSIRGPCRCAHPWPQRRGGSAHTQGQEAISVHVSDMGSNFHRSFNAPLLPSPKPIHASPFQVSPMVYPRAPKSASVDHVAVGVVLVDVVAVPVWGLACHEVARSFEGKTQAVVTHKSVGHGGEGSPWKRRRQASQRRGGTDESWRKSRRGGFPWEQPKATAGCCMS